MGKPSQKPAAPAFNAAALPVSPDAPVFGEERYARQGNCYAYALGLTGARWLQPGELGDIRTDYRRLEEDCRGLSGKDYHASFMPMLEETYKRGAACDGLIEVPGGASPGDFTIPPNHYLVAMFMKCCDLGQHRDPVLRDPDHHWYVQHPDGLWSHRTGGGKAITNLDASGRLIRDPRAMDAGSYDRFSGFFLVPRHIGR